MNPSHSRPPDYQDYATYPAVWSPEEGDQELVMVKVPDGMSHLTKQDYKQLMALRIQWLIHTWMEQSGEDPNQTHRRLSKALRQLYLQEAPNLYENSETGGETLRPLWWWAEEWAETFLNRNDTLMIQFSETELDFPIQIQPVNPELQTGLIEAHTNFTLENWLSNLTYGMTSD